MAKKDKDAKKEEVVEEEPYNPLVCERCGSIMPETGCVCCNRH